MSYSHAELAQPPPLLSVGEVWHRLLAAQLSQARVHAKHHGTLQFELQTGSEPRFFFWTLGEDGVRSGLGIADDAKAWIITEERHLEAMLRREALPKGALGLLGDLKFARGVLEKAAAQSHSLQWS